VSWRDRVSNESIRDRMDRHVTVVDIITRRKLKLFGHICRMKDHRLVKTVLPGMVRGRQSTTRETSKKMN